MLAPNISVLVMTNEFVWFQETPGQGDLARAAGLASAPNVHAYRCVGVAARNRQNNCVHRPCCGRLSPGACDETFWRQCRSTSETRVEHWRVLIRAGVS